MRWSSLHLHFALLLLLFWVFPVEAQQPSPSWSIAKPIVEKWDNEYRNTGRTIAARDRIMVEINQLLRDHPSEIWAYEAAALGFNHLNLNGDAIGVMRDYLRRFQGDDTLINRVWFFFMNWGNLSDVTSLPPRWQQHTEYWQTLFQIYARTNADPDLLEKAGAEVLARIPPERDSGGNERSRIAEVWLRHGVDSRAAERVAREAVAIAEVGDRPSVIPSNDEQAIILKRLLVIHINRSTLGWALFHQSRFGEALAEFQRATAISEKENIVSRGLYYRLGRTLEKLKRPNEALQAYFKGLAWEDEDKETQAAITNLYRRMRGSTVGLNALQRTRVNDFVAARAAVADDLVRTIDEDLGRFEPLDIQGHPFDISQFRGKVVIVDFWATWCGICRAPMEQSNKLQRRFSDKVVVVAWSDDPEETQPQAAQFLKRMRYQFTLVFGDKTRRSLQIPFLPARLIIDRKGRVRVMEFGYSPAAAARFEQKLQTVIGEAPK